MKKGLKARNQTFYFSVGERQFDNKLLSCQQLRVMYFQEPGASGQHPW